jgi:hypothetical protein
VGASLIAGAFVPVIAGWQVRAVDQHRNDRNAGLECGFNLKANVIIAAMKRRGARARADDDQDNISMGPRRS